MGFEAKLSVDEEGRASWACTDFDDTSDPEDLEEGSDFGGGKSVREIGKEIGKPKFTVGRLLMKAKRLKKVSSEELKP
jgi:hypothetical protein